MAKDFKREMQDFKFLRGRVAAILINAGYIEHKGEFGNNQLWRETIEGFRIADFLFSTNGKLRISWSFTSDYIDYVVGVQRCDLGQAYQEKRDHMLHVLRAAGWHAYLPTDPWAANSEFIVCCDDKTHEDQ